MDELRIDACLVYGVISLKTVEAERDKVLNGKLVVGPELLILQIRISSW